MAINYRTDDFVERVNAATDKRGVNVILDMVGGDYIAKNMSITATDGRIVNIAYQQGPKAHVNFLPVMLRRLTITGSTLRPQSSAAKASIAQQLREHIWPKLESGTVKPVIFKEFDLAEADQAHRLMESSLHIGKIIIKIAH
jgi:NADPH:quinone reductase-like Zn-dependent oxidoreductase